MIGKVVVRRLAEEYIRNCKAGMGEGDAWLFAMESVEDCLTRQQNEFLASVIRREGDEGPASADLKARTTSGRRNRGVRQLKPKATSVTDNADVAKTMRPLTEDERAICLLMCKEASANTRSAAETFEEGIFRENALCASLNRHLQRKCAPLADCERAKYIGSCRLVGGILSTVADMVDEGLLHWGALDVAAKVQYRTGRSAREHNHRNPKMMTQKLTREEAAVALRRVHKLLMEGVDLLSVYNDHVAFNQLAGGMMCLGACIERLEEENDGPALE